MSVVDVVSLAGIIVMLAFFAHYIGYRAGLDTHNSSCRGQESDHE